MILSAEDGKLFYELWMPLLQYANKRTKMFPDIKFKKDTAIDVRFGRDMAEWIWNHTEVIDDYLKEHPGMKEDHKNIASISKDSKITGYKDKMMKVLETGDYDGYETMVEALHSEEVEDSEIKSKIATKYRDQYKEAYRKGNYERMSEIEEILDNTGYSFDVGAWEDQVDETLGK